MMGVYNRKSLIVGEEGIGSILKRHRLRWFGHVERKEDANSVKRCTNRIVGGPTPVGRLCKTWQSSVMNDMQLPCKGPFWTGPSGGES